MDKVIQIDVFKKLDGRYTAELSGIGTDVPWAPPETIADGETVNDLLRLLIARDFCRMHTRKETD